jgi:SAM-dependent methyltransferase
MARLLSTEAARRFYDHFGARQDSQAFYEDRALEALVQAGGFGAAQSVLEFGCGTGRFAQHLIDGSLPTTARYAGCDISATMIGLARQRLAPFAPRVTLWQSDGAPDFAPAAPPFDRIVTTYVLDLLPEADITAFLRAAKAALTPGGMLSAVSLTPGDRPLSRITTALWRLIHRLNPALVGGCRPLSLTEHLAPADWQITHHEVSTSWTIASEVVVARRR